jgi:hypothetical protein
MVHGAVGIGLMMASSAAVPATRSVAGPPHPFVQTAARATGRLETPAVPTPATAPVTLALDAPATRERWHMRVTNDGDVPVRIVADARWLALDVTPRSARRPLHCELPSPMRPQDPLERALVLPPKRAYVEVFDPRLYCFGAKSFDALASGSIVVGRLGWTGPSTTGPWAVAPMDGIAPEVAAARSVEAPPIALPDQRPARRSSRSTASDDPLDPLRLTLESTEAVDALSPEDVEIPVTLRNDGSIPVTVRFQPEMLGFDVVGPGADERCMWPTLPAAPTRELFTTISPKGEARLTVVLRAYCSDRTFERSGLLTVRAWLDARDAGGASVGLRAFEGRVFAAAPTLVRLQRGSVAQPLVRPRLQVR